MTKHKQSKARTRRKIKERQAKVQRDIAQCKQDTRITVMPPTVPANAVPSAVPPSLAPTIGEGISTPTEEPNVEDEFDKSME